jgi:apolipoprotein N-acyltransferase
MMLGAMAVLALQPYGVVFLLPVAFGGLAAIIDRARTWQRGLAAGWFFAFGFFVAGLSWISESFSVDPERFGALAIPAVTGLSAGLALFPAAACAGAVAISVPGPSRHLALAASWSLAELARGTVLGGFPWNLVGYAWVLDDRTMQIVSVIGHYGLSFVTVACAAMASGVLAVRRPLPIRLLALAPFPALALGLWMFGAVRLDADGPPDTREVRLRLVQPGIEQRLKWRAEERERILSRLLELSQRETGDRWTVLLWPESALPYLLTADSSLTQALTRILPTRGLLLTGAARREGATSDRRYFNSLVALDNNGKILALYDKARLVPFGEYVPLRSILPIKKLTVGEADFTPGAGAKTISLAGLAAFQPLICYEAIFPRFMPSKGPPARWLLNVTNDAWFGTSSGPWQHLASARSRVVERGVPLVRVANTGISVVTDAYGRIRAQLGLGESGVIDSSLPSPLPGSTLYVAIGEWPWVLVAIAVFLGCALRRRTGQRGTADAI